MRIEALDWHAQSNWISLPVNSNLICPAFSEDDSNAPDFFFPPPAFSVCWEVLMHRMDLRPQDFDSCNNWTTSALSDTEAWSNSSQQKSETDSLQPQTIDTEQFQAVTVHMHWSDNSFNHSFNIKALFWLGSQWIWEPILGTLGVWPRDLGINTLDGMQSYQRDLCVKMTQSNTKYFLMLLDFFIFHTILLM